MHFNGGNIGRRLLLASSSNPEEKKSAINGRSWRDFESSGEMANNNNLVLLEIDRLSALTLFQFNNLWGWEITKISSFKKNGKNHALIQNLVFC